MFSLRQALPVLRRALLASLGSLLLAVVAIVGSHSAASESEQLAARERQQWHAKQQQLALLDQERQMIKDGLAIWVATNAQAGSGTSSAPPDPASLTLALEELSSLAVDGHPWREIQLRLQLTTAHEEILLGQLADWLAAPGSLRQLRSCRLRRHSPANALHADCELTELRLATGNS